MNLSFRVSRFSDMKALLLLVFLIHCVLARHKLQSDSSSIERLALLELRSSLGIRAKEWPIKAEHCESWRGVRCVNGLVTEINVSKFKRTRKGKLNPSFAIYALGNLTQLSYFNASGFSLPGTIPEWFGQRLGSLQVLDLSSCSILGAIPLSIGGLSKLELLHLGDNELTGNIPSALGGLSMLLNLDLSRNSLTGWIPQEFVFLGNLTSLDLSSNFLSGSILPGFGTISGLQYLNLSDNNLSDSVPSELGNLGRLIELDFSKNSLSGSLPIELKDLRNLQLFDVGYNGLEGSIPKGLLSSLPDLQVMVVSGNKLHGALPSVIWSMSKLQFFDVSGNKFFGGLPSTGLDGNTSGAFFNLSNNELYGTLNIPFGKFGFIDLSGNYFQGKVPINSGSNVILGRACLQDVPNQRSLEDCSQFYALRGLKFDNFRDDIETDSSSNSDSEKESNQRLKFILIGVFGGLAFVVLLVLVLILILKACKKGAANQGSANVGPVPDGDAPSLPKNPIYLTGPGESYTFEQITCFTSNFTDANLIKHGHSGDIFRGFLEGGTPVVVKRSFREETYRRELDLLTKISHPRLVPLLGHCLEHENEKILVYKYMPYGDLSRSLHRATSSEDGELKSLDWITRLKIAIGAAEILSHLHHECVPPIIHRDVQSSSILLDDKFEVRLGSLSDSCTAEGDSHHNIFVRRLWKSQSSEQGTSGSLSATCAYDVYCFGIVLLELITGKVGMVRLDDASKLEWLEQTLHYISLYDKDLITKIVDPSLIIDEDLLEEVWAMAIVGRSCLNPKPSKRPLMRYILKALENPVKVVRIEHSSSGRLRTTSSRRSWSAAFLGSWRQSSSDRASVSGQANKEGVSVFKQSGRIGSNTSGGNELPSTNKRLSSEVFPEPIEMEDTERQNGQ